MTVQKLVDKMLKGDRRALARLMTVIENDHPETNAVLAALHSRLGQAYIVGFTGPPGAGKSTLVDRFTGALRARSLRVGIIAIDPSSPFSGGAVLGDRIRMQSHYLDDDVFIRSMSTRGSHGGLARATRNLARLLDAFGKQFVLIETVGVGQTELDVMRLADTTVVVLVPEAGDTVQTMKAGLLEVADIFVVNKADRDGADRIKTELEMMLQLRPPSDWNVPVLLTQATEGRGVDELLDSILRHRDSQLAHGFEGPRDTQRLIDDFVSVLRDELGRRVQQAVDSGSFKELVQKIGRGEIDPYSAALRLVEDREYLVDLIGSHRES